MAAIGTRSLSEVQRFQLFEGETNFLKYFARDCDLEPLRFEQNWTRRVSALLNLQIVGDAEHIRY